MTGRNTLKLVDKEVAIVILCKGKTASGKPYYAYLQILPSRLEEYKAAERKGNFRLEDYGKVLTWEYALEPSDQVKRDMELVYGVSHHFERDLRNKLKELQQDAQ